MDDIELTQFSRMQMTCPFRTCNWTSEDVRTMSLDDQEFVAAEHLQHHRSEIKRMFEAIS